MIGILVVSKSRTKLGCNSVLGLNTTVRPLSTKALHYKLGKSLVIRLVSVADQMQLPDFHDVFRTILGWRGDLGYIGLHHSRPWSGVQQLPPQNAVKSLLKLPRQEMFLYTPENPVTRWLEPLGPIVPMASDPAFCWQEYFRRVRLCPLFMQVWRRLGNNRTSPALYQSKEPILASDYLLLTS
jgi:hypothetical protein